MTIRLASLAQGRAAPLALVALMAACSKSSAPPPQQSAPPPPPAAPGTVSGRAPAPQAGAAVIVILEPATTREFPPQSETPVMDQVGQTFGPPFLLVRTGEPVEFRNSDDTLHNVHVNNEETREGAFNVAIPTGSSYTFKFPKDGFYHAGCDIHPAMAAEIISTTTPFATLAEPDGRFVFENVPSGAYTLTVYANGAKAQRPVEIKGDAVTVDAR